MNLTTLKVDKTINNNWSVLLNEPIKFKWSNYLISINQELNYLVLKWEYVLLNKNSDELLKEHFLNWVIPTGLLIFIIVMFIFFLVLGLKYPNP